MFKPGRDTCGRPRPPRCIFVPAVCAAALLVPVLALGETIRPTEGTSFSPKYSSFDRRASLTLANSVGPRPIFTLFHMDDGTVKGFLKNKDDAKRTATYYGSFGAVWAGKDDRGFVRITVGEELSDPSRTGWKPLGKDRATGTEELWKRPEKFTGPKYTEVAVRKMIGRVILTAYVRRPFEEDPADGVKQALVRYRRLYSQARTNGLFSTLSLIVLDDSDQEADKLSIDPWLVSIQDKPRKMKVRVKVEDPEGGADLPLREVSLRLAGRLARFAKVEGGELDTTTGKYVVKSPPANYADFTVILDGLSPQLLKALADQSRAASSGDVPDYGLRLQGSARFVEGGGK